MTDILFALDSIPAIYGLTNEPYIVFATNAFALLGLVELYFLIGEPIHVVPPISTWLSLVIILSILAVTTIASLLKSRRDATRPTIG